MSEAFAETLIRPDWPAPARVRAVSTTRRGGVSQGRYRSLNLGYHPADDDANVAENRRRLITVLGLPAEPAWLRQVHGNNVIAAEQVSGSVIADASYTRQPGAVCVVMTADCLPVLLCDRVGTCVAAAHAGWRGLVRGVIAATVTSMNCTPEELMVWLGPAIGPQVYEVGGEVRDAFLALAADNIECFTPSPAGRWLADISELARRQLAALGIMHVYGGRWCTHDEHLRFFSYRRDGSSGRMASLIWLSE